MMNTPPPRTKRKTPLIITPRDERILRAIYQYRYMTALDVAYLLFQPSSFTHVREILSALAGGEDLGTHTYLCRFGLPAVGNAVRVFTLGAKGRRYLTEELGVPVSWYFRPYKLKQLSTGHVLHSLILTRFLVAAQCWSRKQPDFTLFKMRLGYELGSTPGRVTLLAKGKPKTVPVIPDAWLLFERVKNGNHIPILLEIDRGMEYQQRFKQHVRARIKYIEDGGYTRTFATQSATIAYATTGQTPAYRERRREAMRLWTAEVLAELHMQNWAGVFRFASVEYQTLYDLTVFEKPVWFRPDSPAPMPLLTP
jgi:hypothetical protein